MAVTQISEEAIEAVSEMDSICGSSKNEVQINEKTTSKRRNKNPGIRKVGSRLYDPETGKSCHQCRQKTMDFAAECKNPKDKKPCPIKYCHKCLLNRYGEKAEEVGNLPDWDCPKCRGICNCSFCRKKRGQKPTGILTHMAKANGYNSVSQMLQADSSTNLNNEKPAIDVGSSPKKKAASETHSPISLSRKRGKEITVDEKVETNSQASSSLASPGEQNPKKVKVKGGTKLDSAANIAIPEVMLPVGAELTTVCGIEIPPEDVGKALQFLEFCAAFGEIFEVKNGHPESILRDLIDGRSSRPGRFSLAVRFHIRLISLIQRNPGEGSSDLSPTHAKDSWVHALKESISGSEESSKLKFLERLDKGADGYENLNSSEKLMILNMLCDEVLNTEKVRDWINYLISEHNEKSKEEKERVHAAKDKEKHLKQKMQDEVARTIIKKNGVPLTISEHDALVAQIKIEAAHALDEMLESISLKKRNETCDAIRTEIFHLDKNGHVYWRLKCLSSSSSEMLVQDVGTNNLATSVEKWYSLDNEQKEVVEKHVNKLRIRRRWPPKVGNIIPTMQEQ